MTDLPAHNSLKHHSHRYAGIVHVMTSVCNISCHIVCDVRYSCFNTAAYGNSDNNDVPAVMSCDVIRYRPLSDVDCNITSHDA